MAIYGIQKELRPESDLTQSVQVELGADAMERINALSARRNARPTQIIRDLWALALAYDGEIGPCRIASRKLGTRVFNVRVTAEMHGQLEAFRNGGSKSGAFRALAVAGLDMIDHPELAKTEVPEVASE